MENKEKSLLILLLLATLFKGIVWASVIPLWHGPDEQAHFAQVQDYAELKQGLPVGNDLSLEIFESERLLGTLRDERGINKFTYHPEYRIEYSQTTLGKYEATIANLPRSSRTTFVKAEAARYPPLFYVLSAFGYLPGYSGSLFVRVFLTRLISVIFGVLTVWAAFLLAKAVFPKNILVSISIAALVSFQPMFSFLSAGVNNDNLMNLLSATLLWLMVDALRRPLSLKHALGIGTVLGLGVLTKQLIYPFIPLPLLLVGYELLIRKRSFNTVMKFAAPFALMVLVSGGFLFARSWLETGTAPGWPQVTPQSPGYSLTIGEYLSQKIPQLYRETLPWYWGVFNWLGVVLPRNALRLIKLTLAISGLGLLQYALRKLRAKKLDVVDWQLLLLAFSSLWYACWLLFWEYMLIRSIGFSHGIQGRNFFPTLAAHMTLLGFGLFQLFGKSQKTILKGTVIAIVLLNFVGLKTLAETYYTTSPLTVLITQASQYKPWFFKGIWLMIWFVVYLTALGQFLSRLLVKQEEKA